MSIIIRQERAWLAPPTGAFSVAPPPATHRVGGGLETCYCCCWCVRHCLEHTGTTVSTEFDLLPRPSPPLLLPSSFLPLPRSLAMQQPLRLTPDPEFVLPALHVVVVAVACGTGTCLWWGRGGGGLMMSSPMEGKERTRTWGSRGCEAKQPHRRHAGLTL